MMQPLKQALREHLAKSPDQWFTIERLMKELPSAFGRSETLTRALRRLVEDGILRVERVVGERRMKQWSLANSAVASLPMPTLADDRPDDGSAMMATQTILDATIDLVQEYVREGKIFSAYNITTELRQRVNAGKIAITNGGGRHGRNLDHAPIRQVVHELFEQGTLDSYTRTLQDVANVQYWLYEPLRNGSLAC